MQLSKEEQQFTKMTETSVRPLILRLAVPTTISMLITNIYNTADTFFVSKVSVSASAATGVVFALMAVFQAFGFMFGHGAGSNVSRLLGARKEEYASEFTSTSFFLAMLTGILVGLLGLLFINPLMVLLGSTETILPEARAYGKYILLAGPAMTCSCVLNNILRYEGRAAFAMIGLTTGGILNMLLDPLFIFTFRMQTAGAGLATMVSQYISLLILLIPFLRNQTATRVSIRRFTKDIRVVGNILATGLPNLLRQGLTSISVTILNNQAAVYGDAAIAAFSIVSRCANLLFSFALGIAQGFQPVCAFNFGAGKYSRVRDAFRFTILMAVSLVGIFSIGCWIFAPQVISLFRSEEEVLAIGSRALRFTCCGILALPFSSIGSMFFQSVGRRKNAILLAALQSGAVFIPLLILLPFLVGLTGLELSQPLSYVIAALISVPLCVRLMKELRTLETGEAPAAGKMQS